MLISKYSQNNERYTLLQVLFATAVHDVRKTSNMLEAPCRLNVAMIELIINPKNTF